MNRSVTPNRSRLPPSPSRNNDDSSYNAALRGASLAFQKSSPKPPPVAKPSQNVNNGALIAATSATSATSASQDRPRTISRQTTGSSVQGANSSLEAEYKIASQPSTQHLQPPPHRNHGASSPLGTPTKQGGPDPRSPSFIAATLAASRSASPVHHQIPQSHPHTQQPTRRRPKNDASANNSAASSVASLDLVTDTTPIPSTNTLISMFENKGDDTDPVKKSTETLESQKSHESKPGIRSLNSPKAVGSIVNNELSPSRLASSRAWERATSPSEPAANMAQEESYQSKNAVNEAKGRPHTPPPTRTRNKVPALTEPGVLEFRGKPRALTPPPKSIGQADTVILSPRPRRSASQILVNDIRVQDTVPKGQTSPPRKPEPQPPSPLYDTTAISPLGDDVRRSSISSDDSFVSASSVPTPHPGSPERGRSRPSSPGPQRSKRPPSAQTVSTPTPSKRPPALPRRQTQSSVTNLPLDSLTDAIVAGSLASSRLTPSAAQTPPPPLKPPSRRQTPHMRQTLRRPLSKSDDEDASSRARSRRRKPLAKLGGGNKHVHHEGSRKRWREEITPRERKRYEGVWASNRGLLLAPPDGASGNGNGDGNGNGKDNPADKEWEQVVANVVVRDIWARSRLPPDELAEVWDLVDRRGRGYLDRTEFVVGMWLIDQRLRGRKIPRKVSESVWGSARGVRVAPPKG